MNKYINADKLIKILKGIRVFGADILDFNDAVDYVTDLIDEMPSADVVEVKHGEWVYQSGNYFTCTNCGGNMVRNVFPFCPWCGAAMRERKETE